MSIPARRLALTFLVLVAAACDDSKIAAPPGGYSISSAPSRLPAPSDVRTSLVGGGKGVVISWTYWPAMYNASSASGFLVERGSDDGGRWSILGFTRESSMGDAVTADQQQCYRVTAVAQASPERNSVPSTEACVGKAVF